MSQTQIADTRKVRTIEDADRLLATIRRLACEREVIVARAEKRIAALSHEALDKTQPLDTEIQAVSAQLSDFILANQTLFVAPRNRRTSDGTYGLQSAKRLEVLDADKLLNHILDCGYDDCVKITRSLVKPKIISRIEDGKETFPGAQLLTGDIAHYSIAKSLIEEARKNA